MVGVVLSGGGAKGAYQLGVWKALRRLKVNYTIVTGTSVGALNGALMVQKDYMLAKWMWYNINFNSIFTETIDHDFSTYKGKLEVFKMYLSNMFLNGGIDVSRLEETINNYVSYKKFYKSKIDFALVTVNLSTFKPVVLDKKNIPKDKLKDYLMASATCFPAFKIKHIDEDLFVDGAYYDNLPINQAIKMGATEIIAVDLNSIGLKKKISDSNIPITYIKPRNKLDSFLYFHKDFTRRSIKLGFNDTMKTFDKLDGNKYTFKLGDLNKNHKQYFMKFQMNLISMTKYATLGKNITCEILNKTKFAILLNGTDKQKIKSLNTIIEYLAEIFKVDETVIYNIKNYNKLLIKTVNNYEDFNFALIEEKIRNRKIIKLADRAYVIKYLYNKILLMENDDKIKRELCNYALFLDKELLGAIYLYTIENKELS